MNNGFTNGGRDASGDIFSWVVIVICLLAFWPLGLFLLIRKITVKPLGTQSANRQGTGYGNSANAPRYGESASGTPTENKVQNAQAGRYQKTAHGNKEASEAAQGGAPKPKKPIKVPGQGLATWLLLLGLVFIAAGGASLLAGIQGLISLGLAGSVPFSFAMAGFFLSGGIISLITRGFVKKRTRRLNTSAAVIAGRDAVPVAEIAEAIGCSLKRARADLENLLECGCFGPFAYIDTSLDSFVISFEAAEKARSAASAPVEAQDGETADGVSNPFVSVVSQLHMICARTSDPVICGKITQIETLTIKIFKTVEDHPEKRPLIRRFMNYYLPTTLKLLHTYETLEKQGIDGENITTAKQDIERILDTLTAGFKQQLDNLFQSDKLDISSDITVLENLLTQDGLKDDGNILKTAGGS
ncbi:5-bromo-4-chloroindolyl phosphate hydrolysis family protein [Oscillospiraceae bacterium CM]|nr:5-bromo-4-chloroindolyl phosphate hydrolysis family protein [Oscillospiraceae bacterium CM]